MQHTLEFLDDPRRFLDVTGSLLAGAPVESTVVASVTARMVRQGTGGEGSGAPPVWWLVVRDDAGQVVGAGMRTAGFAPYPPYLLAMPEPAARDLARVVHARAEQVTAVNGASASVEPFADEVAELSGRVVRVAERMRLYEVTTVVDHAVPEGRLEQARPEEVDLVLTWFDAFALDAAEQAGGTDAHPAPIETRDSLLSRIVDGEIWLWRDGAGRAVHVTAFNPPSFGVARVGPVYTPRQERGRGYAAAAVAEVSRRLLTEGARVCLFADLANPVSGALYVRLGFRPLSDWTNVVIV